MFGEVGGVLYGWQCLVRLVAFCVVNCAWWVLLCLVGLIVFGEVGSV